MKRKQSFSTSTEESFDSLMAVSQKDFQEPNNGDEHERSVCKKHGSKELRLENDKDSDYEGSENNKDVTTLRMLFEKSQVDNVEFAECCQYIGLLRSDLKTCDRCGKERSLVATREGVDCVLWKCEGGGCEALGIRRGSWCEGLELPLKDLVVVVYCWTRGYSEKMTSHETDVDAGIVETVFAKCQSVAGDYFKNPVSNLGGPGEQVYVDLVDLNGRQVLGGVELTNKKDFFFRLIGDKTSYPSRDETVSTLVDNLITGTSLVSSPDSRLFPLLGDGGLAYLSQEWDLSLTKNPSQSDTLMPRWDQLVNLLGNDLKTLQKSSRNDLEISQKSLTYDSETTEKLSKDDVKISQEDLDLLLFRKRMESFKDPFLFFMAVIGSVYHS